MPFFYQKYTDISKDIEIISSKKHEIIPKIIAVSKNQPIASILEAINFGVRFFAENKVQEALLKFNDLKKNYNDLELHMTGSMQTNKVKKSLKILYGGSVNAGNIGQLKNIRTIDGFLIGGASQDSKKFIDIIKKTYI